MHFSKRVLSHVRTKCALDEEAYKALSKDQRRHWKLELMQVANDICRIPGANHQSPAARHAWVAAERARLGIDVAVGDWKGKQLLYHLKAKPHRFLNCMRIMSAEKETAGGKAFGLYPIRRTNVPRHTRFDQKALRDILGLGSSDYIKQKAKERRKRKRDDCDMPADDDLNLLPLRANGAGYESDDDGNAGAAGPSSAPPPKPTKARRTKAEMEAEQMGLFAGIVDLRAAGVRSTPNSLYDGRGPRVPPRLAMHGMRMNGGMIPLGMVPVVANTTTYSITLEPKSRIRPFGT